MPLQILIVDDHPDSATALARLLQRSGHFVATASSQTDGVIAAAHLPRLDLLISDIEMPGGNGCDLLPLLREHRNGGPRHAVALTGYGGEEWEEKCRAAGYDAFIQKPGFEALMQFVAGIERVTPSTSAPSQR